jgi:very-short-patch-repair endonuclease/prenyltransferase beta subunit
MSASKLIPADLLKRARAMRQEAAPAEVKLWRCLRDRQLGGFKFRRQAPQPPYIADFYCAQLQLVIELDGDSHAEQEAYDARRTQRLTRDGLHVIRFLNTDVQSHLDSVLGEILCECERLLSSKSPSPQPSPGVPGEGVMPDRRKAHVRTGLFLCVTTGVLLFPASRYLFADDASSATSVAAEPNKVRGDEITPAQQHAVESGLNWLSHRQGPDGSFTTGMQGYSNRAAISALASIALMQSGNLPNRGKYGREVERALRFILSSCQESGLISADAGQGPMYGHGFATLMLGEIYGMTGDEEVKDRLERAVRLIEKTQNPEGGWRYQPVPYDADISVTICQVMALRAARDAGIKVDKKVIDQAIHYVRSCQNPDGGFSYMSAASGGGAGGSGFARSAAGVAALYYAGIFEGNDLIRGLDYVKQFTPGHGPSAQNEGHYYYGFYYATQAMFLAGGKYWEDFYPAIRNELISNQKDSHWEGDFNDEYATSMALIILQMPNRYMPVYAGKGPGS